MNDVEKMSAVNGASRFELVNIVARRARQITAGAGTLIPTRYDRNASAIAGDEVEAGLVVFERARRVRVRSSEPR